MAFGREDFWNDRMTDVDTPEPESAFPETHVPTIRLACRGCGAHRLVSSTQGASAGICTTCGEVGWRLAD